MATLTKFALYFSKEEPPNIVSEITLVEDLGVEGDVHMAKGDREVSLFSDEARDWMNSTEEKGLCFVKFYGNIQTEGIALEELKERDILTSGDVEIEITSAKKECHAECPLFSQGKFCMLPICGRFAKVNKGGTLHLGDEIFVN